MVSGEAERGVFTVRVPSDLQEELRAYRFFTQRPVNEVVVELIREFLAGPGRAEIERGMSERAQRIYGKSLAELAAGEGGA